MKQRLPLLFFLGLLAAFAGCAGPGSHAPFNILVFSGTAGEGHVSTADGRAAIQELGRAHGFAVDTTEDASIFSPEGLSRYDVVVFLNTSGDVLDETQQEALEAYVRAGGGFAGIHAATAPGGAWYGEIVGGTTRHQQQGERGLSLFVLDAVHPATQALPRRWTVEDDEYFALVEPSLEVHVLATVATGPGGRDAPISWAHHVEAGRVWITGLGHAAESYQDARFRQHLLGGLQWAAGVVEGDLNVTSSSLFRKVVLDGYVTRPNALEVAPDGRVFFIEREGAVKVWDPATAATYMVGFLPVHAVHTSGLLGLALDPAFTDNGWIYVYYSPYDDTKNVLARFTLVDDRLVPESKKVLLEVPVQRQVSGGHSGGDLAFGPDGNLYLGTGDNTSPFGTGFAPLDERPGHETEDAQRSSGNTHDLRGKILRIRPLPDGSYAIPEGNLFPYGSLGRPEIYAMGTRNPYRLAVDAETGWLYWGDIGPDANTSDDARGPAGYDEVNQAREAGNYGWPYFIANNLAYRDYDYTTGASGPAFDATAPVNASVNNTGARVLPPARQAMIWYPYQASSRFPELGAGGRAVMAGAVYRYDAETTGTGGLPAYYDGSLFVFDFMRNWIKEVKFDDDGHLLRINPFLEAMPFLRPMDMDIGPDGALYLIEWGGSYEGWYNDDARLARIDYLGTDTLAMPDTTTAPSPSPVAITWPVHGGFFDFHAPIDYRLSVNSDAVDEERIAVSPALAHDAHLHPLSDHAGLTGRFTVLPDETHLYLEDQYAVLEVQIGAERPMAVGRWVSPTRILLQPRRKQAEHTTSQYGIEREFTGDAPDGNVLRTRVNVQAALVAGDGDYAAYAPVNLLNIESLTFRVAPLYGGRIAVHLDAPDGPLLAEVVVAAAQGTTDVDPWQTVDVAVDDPGGVHELFLVFEGAEDGALMKLDWIEFNGAGIMRRGDFTGTPQPPETVSLEPVQKQGQPVAGTASGDGQQVYITRCTSCHQANGEGIPERFPPLDGSEWVADDAGRLIRIVLHGMTGEAVVRGNTYNGVMPAWGATLSDEDVAAVLTFIRSSWSNEAGAVTADEVARIRDATQDRTQPWTVEELE